MVKYNIYCLIDPNDEAPFYVGATVLTLKQRLSGHLNRTLKTKKESSMMLKRFYKIQALLDKGTPPIIKLLEIVPQNKVDEKEAYYYNTFTSEGFSLLQSNRFFNYQIKNTKSYKVRKEGFKTVTLRVGLTLHKQLEVIADADNRELTSLIRIILSEHIKKIK